MAAGKPAGKKAEPEVDEEAVAAAALAAKQKKKKLFLFIGVGILLVFLSIGGTVLAIKLLSPKAPANGEQASESSSEADEASESNEPTLPASYYPLKPNFTVNYDVNGRQRFLQAELTLMYRDEAILKVLELHMPAVRNGLVLLLSSQSFDELQTPEGKEKLRAAALKTVQDILEKERAAADKDKEKSKSKKPAPTIEQVLFTNFVMQ